MPKRLGPRTVEHFLSESERAKYARVRLEDKKRLFDVEENPVFAWEAFALARDFDVAIPPWVLEYFDMSAANLAWQVFKQQQRRREGRQDDFDAARAIYSAMGFTPGGVELTFIRDHYPDSPEATRENMSPVSPLKRNGLRDLRLAKSVHMLVRHGKIKASAVRAVADAHKVSVRMVYRALAKYPLM